MGRRVRAFPAGATETRDYFQMTRRSSLGAILDGAVRRLDVAPPRSYAWATMEPVPGLAGEIEIVVAPPDTADAHGNPGVHALATDLIIRERVGARFADNRSNSENRPKSVSVSAEAPVGYASPRRGRR
jgi:hypothetical protein